jgi:vacuolar protein sorting-associated protein 45
VVWEIGVWLLFKAFWADQAKKEFQDIVLSARQDEFFGKNMYSNFGDLGTAVKSLVDEFQKHTANSRNLNTIRDMQDFVENFSEFSAAQRNAGKHVTLVSELSRLVDARTLMQVWSDKRSGDSTFTK